MYVASFNSIHFKYYYYNLIISKCLFIIINY